MKRWRSICIAWALLSLVLLTWTGTARASDPGLGVRMEIRQSRVVAAVKPSSFIDNVLRKRLGSGLSNRLVYTALLQPDGFGGPLYQIERELRIVYDLWEEKYLIESRGGGDTFQVQLDDLQAVERWLHRETKIELGAIGGCEPGRRYRLDVRLAINPISRQVRERSREMITGDPGDRGAGSRSLFGSVARVFLNVSSDQGVRELRGLSSYQVVRSTQGAR